MSTEENNTQGLVIRHPDFARRFAAAADSNPVIPPLNSGRLTYIVEELGKRGHEISVESVRKWFAGVSRPRRPLLAPLAEIMRVDELSLLVDDEAQYAARPAKAIEKSSKSFEVSLVAAMLETNGAHVAFPASDDALAADKSIDIYAIIDGKMTPITVVEGIREISGFRYRVPAKARNNVVLAVNQSKLFSIDVFKLDWSKVTGDGEFVELSSTDNCWSIPQSLKSLI